MTSANEFDEHPDGHGHRSGVAARIAGVPVETLRVWERRYGLSEPQRSAHGQRLYSDAQVRRLALIKRLVDQGHPIGALAQLPVERLGALVRVEAGDAGAPVRIALAGYALARQLLSAVQAGAAAELVRTCAGLGDAPAALAGSGAEVLLVEVPELVPDACDTLVELQAACGAPAAVLLYRFANSATVARLRARGWVVARAPADPVEIVLLCQAARAATAKSACAPGPAAPAPVAPPRFDELALAALGAAASRLACECPRHLADILLMLGSFERYSAQCGSVDAADAQLHRDLARAAGSARATLETALERLALAEGLPLPGARPIPNPSPQPL